jgi:pSer/pThr/pTyr-binding forkhead associated (FHA) protein
MAHLIMRRGPTPGAIYELHADTVSIGRGNRNDIIIRDGEVSREHCRLTKASDEYEVQDLDSSNGTFVGGQRVHGKWLLQSGMVIELGDSVTLEYRNMGEIAATSTDPTLVRAPTAAEEAMLQTNRLPAPKYGLIARQGPDKDRIYPLNKPVITIGRDLSSDIVIQDPEVSRHHARLSQTKQSYVVEDLGSTNGTEVNDGEIHAPVTLQLNDIVRLGTMVELQLIPLPDQAMPQTETDAEVNPALHNAETMSKTMLGQERPTTRLKGGLEPGRLSGHIFVAYAPDDWRLMVSPLTLNMQDAGLKVWVDQYLVQGSPEWRAAIEQALSECRAMVLVVSPQSLGSSYVKMEYRFFLKNEKPIIPVICKPVKTIPVELSKLRPVNYSVEDPKRSFHKLLFELKQLPR